jgi:hypothetical protein
MKFKLQTWTTDIKCKETAGIIILNGLKFKYWIESLHKYYNVNVRDIHFKAKDTITL